MKKAYTKNNIENNAAEASLARALVHICNAYDAANTTAERDAYLLAVEHALAALEIIG